MAIDIKITSDDLIEHEGKQYRPVAIRKPKKGDRILTRSGRVVQPEYHHRASAFVILEEVIPPYRTPTDEDAKQRPVAEFWNAEKMPDKPHKGLLIAVSCGKFPFVSGGVYEGVSCWQHCRIPNDGAAK